MVISVLRRINAFLRQECPFPVFVLPSLLALFFLVACAGTRGPEQLSGEIEAYRVAPASSRAARFAPVFLVEESQLPCNRPGTPRLSRSADGTITAEVDPQRPALFVQENSFQGRNGTYRNLIYRIHFKEVPPGHLSSGKNVGLIVMVTLDDKDRPLLYTTVHTCGCYLAFLPTSNLPEEAFPAGWSRENQKVYGESLPGLLRLPEDSARVSFFVALRSKTHRVMDAGFVVTHALAEKRLPLLPMESLDNLPLNGGTASFFEEKGKRKGYVRNSRKFWERFLLSWWTFDTQVGEDKALGPAEVTGTAFYTSLKPWARKSSDLWQFHDFFTYWGWQL